MYKQENVDTILLKINTKKLNIIKKKIILTVSVGWAYMQLGSLQFGQFLQRTFLVATLLANISFCSSGVNLLKASWSIKFFFSSVVFSPSLFSFCSPSGFCSEGFPSFSLFSSGFSFFESDSGLAVVTCFFVGGFFFNLLKN